MVPRRSGPRCGSNRREANRSSWRAHPPPRPGSPPSLRFRDRGRRWRAPSRCARPLRRCAARRRREPVRSARRRGGAQGWVAEGRSLGGRPQRAGRRLWRRSFGWHGGWLRHGRLDRARDIRLGTGIQGGDGGCSCVGFSGGGTLDCFGGGRGGIHRWNRWLGLGRLDCYGSLWSSLRGCGQWMIIG